MSGEGGRCFRGVHGSTPFKGLVMTDNALSDDPGAREARPPEDQTKDILPEMCVIYPCVPLSITGVNWLDYSAAGLQWPWAMVAGIF